MRKSLALQWMEGEGRRRNPQLHLSTFCDTWRFFVFTGDSPVRFLLAGAEMISSHLLIVIGLQAAPHWQGKFGLNRFGGT
jgi:hypothetical protein